MQDHTHTAGTGGAVVVETSAPPASPPGYELRDEIGRGGMGVVHRARDTALDRDVAVKLLSEQYPADSPAGGRFLGEARITGQLQHPGIAAVHQVGTLAGGRPFLAMKLIKGSTLEAILKQRTDPSAQRGRLLAVFEAVCQAVGYAHSHRVIHRDLKPANVMVGAFGEVQVMDWGLAKVIGEQTPATAAALAAEQTRVWTQVSPTPEFGSHTQAGSLLGTPAFAPPELVGGEIDKVDTRADVFGLGAILAVILTGQPPYVGETAESVRVLALRGKLDDCFLWAKEKAPDLDMRFERTRALALLAGLGGDAKSGVRKDEAQTFADQSVAALRDAIGPVGMCPTISRSRTSTRCAVGTISRSCWRSWRPGPGRKPSPNTDRRERRLQAHDQRRRESRHLMSAVHRDRVAPPVRAHVGQVALVRRWSA